MTRVAWPLIWLLVCAGPAFGATEMAVTVDDLPAHGALSRSVGTIDVSVVSQIVRVKLDDAKS